MNKGICRLKKLEKTSLLKAGDEVLLVRAEDYEIETFIVKVTCPIESPPIGESLETGVMRVLTPVDDKERFYLIQRAA